MKIRLVGAELFHADDGQTDITKLQVAFRNFANAPKNEKAPPPPQFPPASLSMLQAQCATPPSTNIITE